MFIEFYDNDFPESEMLWIRKSKIDNINAFTAVLVGDDEAKKRFRYTHIHPAYWPPGLPLYLKSPSIIGSKGRNARTEHKLINKKVVNSIETVLLKYSHMVLFNFALSDRYKHSILHTLIEEVARFEGYSYKTHNVKKGFYFELEQMSFLLEYNQITQKIDFHRNAEKPTAVNIDKMPVLKDYGMRDCLVYIYTEVYRGQVNA